MEELLNQLLGKAKRSKKDLIALKNTAAHLRCFELAAKLREMELELFPETDEQKAAKKLGKDLSGVFAMVGLNVTEDVAYVLHEAMLGFKKKGGKFSLRESSVIKANQEKFFN